MTNSLHSTENYSDIDADLQNIILINVGEPDSDELDYDFDYDPNEMYYALANENN